MPGPIICAKCGKWLTLWEVDHGHKCRFDLDSKGKRAEADATANRVQGQLNGNTQSNMPLQVCPACGERSLYRDNNSFECLNLKCKRMFTPEDLSTQENTRLIELITCKHCNERFPTSEYETHLKLLARSVRRGAVCLKCGEPTYYLSHDGVWECLNIDCPTFQKTQSIKPNVKQDDGVVVDPSNKPSSSVIEDREHASDEESMKLSEECDRRIFPPKKEDKLNKRGGGELPKWIIALLFIIAFSIVGGVLSLFVGTFIPLWILFGFSLIVSIEKWFYYFTRKHKGLGILYRLLLNLSILALLGLLTWSGIKLFSQQLVRSSLTGSLIFLSELIFFIWLWRVISKDSWRRPSMKLTVFSLICLSVVFAFAGVQPMANYKDSFLSFIGTNFKSSSQSIDSPPTSTPTITATPVPSPITSTAAPTQKPTSTQGVTTTPTQTPTPTLITPTPTPAPSPAPTPQLPTPIPPVLDKTVTVLNQQYRVQFWQLNLSGRVEATVTHPSGENTNYGSNWSGFTLEQILANAKTAGNKAAWAVALAAGAQGNPTLLTPVPPAIVAPKTLTIPSPTIKATSTPTVTPPPVSKLEELYQYMLDLINKDRKANGLSPVVLGNNGAAQKHAEEMAENVYLSHWGMDGMKPYMRYTTDGGFNYEAENAHYSIYGYTIWTVSGVEVRREVNKPVPKEDLDQAENGWMNSPGHRRNILNKWHKKVNLGLAWGDNVFAAVQQFEGDYISFTKLHSLSGNTLSMAGKLNLGKIDSVALYYDPLPSPMTPKQLNDGPRSYGLGDEAGYILPPPPPGSYYTQVPPNSVIAKLWSVNASGQFTIEADISSILKQGRGVYTVTIWAEIGNESKNVTNYSIFVK